MKDSLVFAFMCWTFALAHRVFFRGRLIYLLPLVLVVYLMTLLKAYVTTAMIPAMVMMAYVKYGAAVRHPVLKLILQPVLLLIMFFGGFKAIQVAGNFDKKFALENAIERAEITQNFIHRTSVRGSSLQNRTGSEYSLPAISGGINDLKLIPLSINVTLFRPYLFEVRNPVMLLASLESTLFLLASLYVIFKVGLVRSVRLISNDPFLIFCLVFTSGFALAVGFSTYNFGALARYKIPILPFYASMLYLLYAKSKITRSSKSIANFS